MLPLVDREVLTRLPLAEATLQLWAWIADDNHLDDLFERLRGRQYTRELTFPVVVRLIADALIQYRGSGRRSFLHGQEDGILDTSRQSVYSKLGRIDLALSEAFLAEGAQRLLQILPDTASDAPLLPSRLQGFDIYIVDGKIVKRVAKLLKPLRGQKGGLLGGKALVALHLQSRLAIAMASVADGEVNDAKLVPALLPQVAQTLLRRRLAVLDSQFCDLTQTALLLAQGDHFVVRAHPKVHFHPDAAADHAHDTGVACGVDERGRTWTQDWGWLGVPHGKKSLYVRRITLHRPGDNAVVIYTDLLNPHEFPAADLLTVYLARWGIERVFQQITEVFDLRSLIGTTPEGTVFQLSFCLLLYNMIQVVRAHVAQAAQLPVETISTELLYEDVRRQLTALAEVVGLARAAELLTLPVGGLLTAGLVQESLAMLLAEVWTERWRKSVNKKPRKHPTKGHDRNHTSVQRVLEEHRRHQKTPQIVVNSP
jgi:hypothetical protein